MPFDVVRRPPDQITPPLIVTVVSSVTAVASRTSGTISQVSDAILATLATGRSLAPGFTTVCHRTHAVAGVFIRASQERLGVLLRSVSSNPHPVSLVLASLRHRVLTAASPTCPTTFPKVFELGLILWLNQYLWNYGGSVVGRSTSSVLFVTV